MLHLKYMSFDEGSDAMSKYLHMLVAWVTRAHRYIMTLNDSFETNFSDKELHFLVIGAIGLALILLVYPVFRLLARRNRVLVITWIYALTVLVVLTFAIEIGQSVTGTGSMEFADVMAGMGGFFAVSAVIAALHLVLWSVKSAARVIRGRLREGRRDGARAL